MERRVLLAVVLSMAVLYAYQTFLAPPPPQPKKTAQQQSTTANEPASAASTTSPSVITAPAPQALVADTAEREIVVETADVEAVMSNRGGRLLHWRLKRYLDDMGKPVDLVPSALPPNQPTPFALAFEDVQLTARVNDALFRTTAPARVDVTRASQTIAFEYEDATGVQIRKEFAFQPQDYLVALSVTAMQGDRDLRPAIAWGPGLGDAGAAAGGGSFLTGNVVQPPQAIFHQDGKVVRLTSSKVAADAAHEGTFPFAGIDDHYFI